MTDILDKAAETISAEELKDESPKKSKLKNRPSFKKDKIDAHYDKLPWILAATGRLLNLKFAPVNIPLERRLQTFATFFWMSTFLFVGFGSLFLMLYILFYTRYWWVALSYFTFFLGDRTICNRGGRRFPFLRRWSLWKHFANFFPIKIIKTCDYDTSQNYIFGYHPHGILSAGAAAHFATEGTNFSKTFPGLTPYFLTLTGHFYLPLYREFVLGHGMVSASKESMNYLLSREKKGLAVGLVIGGAVESLDSHPGQAVLHLKKRKGFCKIALKNGAWLVPTYSFGENEVYEQVANPPGSLIRQVQDALQKIIGLAPCLFIGRGIFQYSFGIVPFRKPINTVFGKPLEVPHIPNPSSKDILDLHERYIKAVTDLYNQHKDHYAEFPSTQLQIV